MDLPIRLALVAIMCSSILRTAVANAQTPPFLSVRGEGLSHAFTVFAEGVDAAFYNPAGLASQGEGGETSIHHLHYPYAAMGSNDQNQMINEEVKTKTRSSGDRSPGSSLSTIESEDTRIGRFSFMPSIQAGRLFIGGLYDLDVSSHYRNTPTESFDFHHKETMGAMFGFSMSNSSRNLRLGLSGSYLQSNLIEGNFDRAAIIDAETRQDIFQAQQTRSTSMPIHMGMQWTISPINQPTLALAVHDFGDTVHEISGVINPPVTKQDLSIGFGLVPSMITAGHLKWSVEMHSLLNSENTSLSQKIHTGIEWHSNNASAKTSRLGLRAGYSHERPSMGAHLSLGLINVFYSYSVYQPQLVGEKHSSEQIHSIALIIDLAG